MTRVKKVLSGPINRTAAEEAFAQFAKADARQKQITSKMDVEITKIREKYQEELAKQEAVKEDSFARLQAFAESNRDEFSGKKSIEFAHGLLGFRTGTPKVKTMKGFTWPSVTNLLKEFLPSYVRITEEAAKDRLIADREVPEVSALFKKVGIYIDQDEAFFVEPKKELAEA
jgi:phage host-nuclease inhibitor protein Gam